MIAGTYYEWLCVQCGAFPQMKITPETDKAVKKIMQQKIREHLKKHLLK